MHQSHSVKRPSSERVKNVIMKADLGPVITLTAGEMTLTMSSGPALLYNLN